jgi:hypothetical protein
MKILFLTMYYQPDLSAGSFRNTSLIYAIQKQLPKGSTIDVITTLPSRYSSFNADAPNTESSNGIQVTRIRLPAHKNGIFDQAKAYLIYVYGVNKIVKKRQYDLVYASSSRLMTAALGSWISRKKQIPLYLDIRDIFVDTVKDILSQKLIWILKPIFSLLERWTITPAETVNLVSGGFRQYFEFRYPRKSFTYFTNGIDNDFINANFGSTREKTNSEIEVVYAGNFGEGQGLHAIIPGLANHFKGRLNFRLIGDGGRRAKLEEDLLRRGIKNVIIQNPVSRDQLIPIYRDADVLFLHLNSYDAFLNVLPSKVFEYAASGKPIWAGVAGFSADFLIKNVQNVAVFNPCDLDQAIEVFESLTLKHEQRSEFVTKFTRETIMSEMANDIIELAKNR